eukprot:TRINITY_DN3763_c0_g1_i2.p1 TRINITY_DN3763_c0_g1~~TRINITY_DN3763_c0_g1_i2.p1  ORF type:complete len:291 (-),score=33.15 TRINITY_DN3763_c0_g1_i2:242-1114(-)
MPEEKTITPLPYGKLFVLSCIGISESFSITMIFPFIANMVRDFGYPEDEIGFYAGWIASSFNIEAVVSTQSTGTCLGVLYCMPEEKTITPLPYGKLFVLSCIGISESFSITMIFPFIANMVRDFGYPEDEIGFYAGWIASSFNIAQFMSSFGWGRVADRIGRRSVLLLGLSGNFLMIFLFGWSTNLWYAILARSMNGFLNGNIGVAKTYLGEISDDTNSATWFFSLFWTKLKPSLSLLILLWFIILFQVLFSSNGDELPKLVKDSRKNILGVEEICGGDERLGFDMESSV